MDPSPSNPHSYANDPPQETTISCAQCGYSLFGSALGGTCAECGKPVQDTLRAQGGSGEGNSAGTVSLVLGLVGVAACALVAPFAWY